MVPHGVHPSQAIARGCGLRQVGCGRCAVGADRVAAHTAFGVEDLLARRGIARLVRGTGLVEEGKDVRHLLLV